MLLYIHGFNSSPASFKANVLQNALVRMGRGAEFLCPALPHRPAQAMALLDAILPHHDFDNLTLIGSSLGGFYATYLTEKYAVRSVLINPAIFPHHGLRAYLGPQKNLYTGEDYILTEQHLDEMRALFVPELKHFERYLLITATGDEVLDYRDGVARYAGAEQIIIQGSDHGLSDFADYLDKILHYARVSSL
jgi:uncharacterized protein